MGVRWGSGGLGPWAGTRLCGANGDGGTLVLNDGQGEMGEVPGRLKQLGYRLAMPIALTKVGGNKLSSTRPGHPDPSRLPPHSFNAEFSS